MADTKPEVVISLALEYLGIKFQRLLSCFYVFIDMSTPIKIETACLKVCFLSENGDGGHRTEHSYVRP